jgi:CRP-like cAMP-binding protein
MKALDAVVAEHPFFAGLAAPDAALVAGCAKLAAFKAGEYLFKAGNAAEHFFLLRHGSVALELQAPGREPYRFQTLGPGHIVGWSWLFEPFRWQFDALVLEDASVLQFDGRCLRGKCEADPRLGYDIMKRFARVMTQRFADTRLQLIDVYGKHGR